jgi:hypothetical protein
VPQVPHAGRPQGKADLAEFRSRSLLQAAECPLCPRAAKRLHSRYERTLADLKYEAVGSIHHVIDAKAGVGLSNDEHIVYDLSQATIAPLIDLGRT